MNYFEFYRLPESFQLDEGLVRKKFYALSKEFHPDFYVNDPPEKQQEILELSTQNNKAFQVLSDFDKRLEHILQLHQLIAEGEKYQLPQSFLMEMMEVNEVLMEMEFEPDPAVLSNTAKVVETIEDDIRQELKVLTVSFDQDADQAEKQSILLKIKDLYYRQKYLLRIRESLNRFALR